MTDIRITVINKVATVPTDAKIYCGNSDNTLTFDFDEEWSAEKTKTVRFVWHTKGRTYHKDVTLENDTLEVPVFINAYAVFVGVYAGDLKATTAAKIPCVPCILCCGGHDEEIDSGMFARMQSQLRKLLNEVLYEEDAWDVVDKYLAENPAMTEEDVQEIIDKILPTDTISQIQKDIEKLKEDAQYVAVKIVSFNVNADGDRDGVVELGTKVGSIGFEWELNKTPTTQTINGDKIPNDIREIAFVRSYPEYPNGWHPDEGYEIKFNLDVSDERGVHDYSEKTINFYNGVYSGCSSDPDVIDSAFISKFSKKLTDRRGLAVVVFCTQGSRFWYAAPVRLGTPTFSVGGFVGGIELVDTIDFTNSLGYTEPYNVYASNKTSLGIIEVVVT